MATYQETKVRRVSTAQGLRELRATVHGYEKSYGCKSSAMLSKVIAGQEKETAEVSRWLVSYQALTKRMGHNGATT